MVTQYNPVDGLATRSYVQMVSSWCYHCFACWGEEGYEGSPESRQLNVLCLIDGGVGVRRI